MNKSKIIWTLLFAAIVIYLIKNYNERPLAKAIEDNYNLFKIKEMRDARIPLQQNLFTK